MKNEKNLIGRIFSNHSPRKILLLFIVLMLILACSSWGILLLEKNEVFARFNLSAELTTTEHQLEQDFAVLEGFGIKQEIINPLEIRFKEFQKKHFKIFYSEDLFDEVKTLYDEVNTIKETEQSNWHGKIEDILISVDTKFSELEHYGVNLDIKKEERANIEQRLLSSETKDDYSLLETLSSQLDFFLQDQINVKRTIYLQENLQSEVTEISELIKTGKGLGVEDAELAEAIKQIDMLHTTSSSEYLYYLEKYQKTLVDGKIRLKESIEKKKKELEEKRNQGNYIPIKPPINPVSGKSIEVSIDEQVLRAYENGEQVFSSFVVTGKNGWWTTKGVHRILYKQMYKVLSMDEPEYYRIPVKYWMPFTYKGEGIHDASFRRTFGPRANRAWNGSHGCVNSPMDTAKFIYYWAEVGTPVIVF